MDIWESNAASSALTPHVCSSTGPYRCDGAQCGDDSSVRAHVCVTVCVCVRVCVTVCV
jgi:cellulose 1,4-beta-cellobiosidase